MRDMASLPTMRPFFAQEHPIAISHRGGAAIWPENTMVAFEESWELGYRFFETDLHLSRDGVVVLLHDHTLERTTDGGGYVWDRTLSELQQLDAGYWFGPEHGYPFRGSDLTIPSLEELLVALPDAFFTLEMKLGLADPVEALLRKLDARDRVVVAGYRDGWIRRFRRLTGGRVPTSTARGEIAAFWGVSRLGRGLTVDAAALQVPPRHRGLKVLDAPFVAAAHAVEKQVHAWTIDDAAQMDYLLDLGVDGIMTDRPDVLKEVLLQRGKGGPWNG